MTYETAPTSLWEEKECGFYRLSALWELEVDRLVNY
jgi:hypothetical protein